MKSVILTKLSARLAQLVRASRLHREGQGFESLGVHNISERDSNKGVAGKAFPRIAGGDRAKRGQEGWKPLLGGTQCRLRIPWCAPVTRRHL